MGKRIATTDKIFTQAISRLVYSNPFSHERIAAEKDALGVAYKEPDKVWNLDPLNPVGDPNLEVLIERSEAVLQALNLKFRQTAFETSEDYELYIDLVYFVLFNRYQEPLTHLALSAVEQGGETIKVSFYRQFERDYESFLNVVGSEKPPFGASDLFARFFQLRRAFLFIFRYIIGSSSIASALRARAWDAVFTSDLKRYQDCLVGRTNEFSVLITGPSGSGKELVARAIGLSGYIAFDVAKLQFKDEFTSQFYPVNLAALSPTLIESELFGHRKGAFTGAANDHKGYFEVSGEGGSVFLDEIGECPPSVQVKLLRVLQSREFQRLGETTLSRFRGRVIAATNRDLAAEMAQGNFREDFFYRLCAMQVATPSLREILDENEDDLFYLLAYISKKLVGAQQAPRLVAEVAEVIGKLGPRYPWNGNFRELEQCARSVLIQGGYEPISRKASSSAGNELRPLSAVVTSYVTDAYRRLGTMEAVARALEIDRRTVKKYLEASDR